MIRGISHVTFSVSDIDRSLVFYLGVLNCRLVAQWDRGAYLEAGSLWLCLIVTQRCPQQAPLEDYSHIALEVGKEDFPALANRVDRCDVRRWKKNRSEGESLYLLDPDGYKIELHVGDLRSRIDSCKNDPYPGMTFFD